MSDETRNHGVQPLDAIMNTWSITNHRLVEESSEQLNHKQVQKARMGRQLTLHLRMKIARQLNQTILHQLTRENRPAFQPYLHKHLFQYAKGHDPEWQDPNQPLFPQ